MEQSKRPDSDVATPKTLGPKNILICVAGQWGMSLSAKLSDSLAHGRWVFPRSADSYGMLLQEKYRLVQGLMPSGNTWKHSDAVWVIPCMSHLNEHAWPNAWPNGHACVWTNGPMQQQLAVRVDGQNEWVSSFTGDRKWPIEVLHRKISLVHVAWMLHHRRSGPKSWWFSSVSWQATR